MKQRIVWIDNARALGMIAVFYGHIIEMLAGESYSGFEYTQFRFIYAFHMPLFFFLSGFLNKEKPISAGHLFLEKFYTLIIPATFLSLLMIPLFMIKDMFLFQSFNPWKFAPRLVGLLTGQPKLNWMTWFIYCLFSVELLHFFVSRWKAVPNWLKFIIFYLAGWLITWNLSTVVRLTYIPANCWYIHEAVIAYSFFLLGMIVNKSGVCQRLSRFTVSLGMCFVFLVITVVTLNLNTGPFYFPQPAVIMSLSQHGHPFFFLLTAVAGIGFIITLSMLIPPNYVFNFIGQNTLVLLGLAGAFIYFGNGFLIKGLSLFPVEISKTTIAFIGTSIAMTVCVPVALVINLLVPQLVGKPRKSGPLLPALMK